MTTNIISQSRTIVCSLCQLTWCQASGWQILVRGRQHRYQVVQAVSLRPGAHHTVQLAPRKGTIRLVVWPWARVKLDGTDLGITPFPPVRAYEGPHWLTLENDKIGARKRMRVQIGPGKETLVKVTLKR